MEINQYMDCRKLIKAYDIDGYLNLLFLDYALEVSDNQRNNNFQ